MPGFISHTVMAKDIYPKFNNNCLIDYLITYSLGGDLSKYAKCRADSHHKDMDLFIYNIADYLKDNNLVNDKECLSLLYGHICHYIMDNKIHPLVIIITKKVKKNKHNHTWIEQYYNEYLAKNIFNMSLKEYTKSGILKSKINRKSSKLIDYVYEKTYHTKHVSRYYKFNLFLYKIERMIMSINAKFWYKINGLDKFINMNQEIDLVNDNNKIKYLDSIGNEIDKSLLSLYNDCLKDAITYIKKINKYLKIN